VDPDVAAPEEKILRVTRVFGAVHVDRRVASHSHDCEPDQERDHHGYAEARTWCRPSCA
jgi:hypothetical protein